MAIHNTKQLNLFRFFLLSKSRLEINVCLMQQIHKDERFNKIHTIDSLSYSKKKSALNFGVGLLTHLNVKILYGRKYDLRLDFNIYYTYTNIYIKDDASLLLASNILIIDV